MADDLRTRIDQLPRLAREAVWHDDSRAIRVTHRSGSAAPPGVDLDRIDAGREHGHLLIRLESCIRVVVREGGDVLDIGERRWLLPRVPEVASWRECCDWLLATADDWEPDDWCREWVETEVAGIERALQRTKAEKPKTIECPYCGRTPDAYTTDILMVAECDRCHAVVAMEQRVPEWRAREIRLDRARNLLKAIFPARHS